MKDSTKGLLLLSPFLLSLLIAFIYFIINHPYEAISSIVITIIFIMACFGVAYVVGE